MKSLAQVVLTGTSCAVFLLSTIASASGTDVAAAVGTSSASFGGDDNRVNSNRRLSVESLTQYAESKRDETADLSYAPADLHGFLQSEPAGGLSNLRGGQQQQQHEEDGKLTGEDKPVVVLHDIFDRFDQIPELAARKGGGGGGSRSKGSKGSGSGSSTGKGSKSKGSKGGSSSDSGKGKGGTKSSKSSTADTNKSSSENKTSRKSDSSSSKNSGGNKRSNDDDKNSSSKSKQSDKSSSDSKKSMPSQKKSSQKKTKKTNAQRMCSTPTEKTCRNNCIDNKCDASDDESSPCAKRCRYKCCSDLQRDDRSKTDGKKGDDSDKERSCNTMEEKSCRSKCFYKKKCRDDECKRECRRDCCVGGRIGSGSKTKNGKDKKKSGEESSAESDGKKKDAGADDEEGGDDGDEDDGKGCDTDVEKQCRDTCYIESSCQNGDRECRKTCRQGCCDVDLSIVDIISNAEEQDGNDGSLMSGDLPLSFRFTINTAERFTADDIMNGRDNSLKKDLEGGLKILVEDVVGESFRGDGWKEESRRARRRKLVVRYQSDSPPTVEDVQDVACPSNVDGSGCKRVRAEATLELEDENENSVRQAFLSAISEAIGDGRLESAIRQFNPDHGSRDPLSNNAESSNDGGGDRSLSNIQIAGIAVGALSFVVLSYLALKICQDRRRRKEERSIQGSSAPGSVSQQGAGHEDDAYHDAYGGDRYEGQRLPPIPEPPQLPDRSSGKPRESKLAAVRRELQADPYEPHTPERALEAGGPSLVDLVATSYTPSIEEATATRGAVDENFDSTHQPSELSDEYYDGVQPSEGAAHAQQSENTLDQYADYEPTATDDYGAPPSPHRYDDGGQGDRVDLSAPIDFSQQQAAGANDYDQAQAYDDQAQGYGEDYHEYLDQEYVEDDYHQEEQYDVEDAYEQQGEEYYDDVQYHEQPMATDSWGEAKHASQYDYPEGAGGGYDEAPPDVAESDVSSKEGGEGGDAMTETSSQKFIATAKRMAAAERDDPQSMAENDAIEDISDRSDDEEAHSQARAYRHRAQAERIGRKSRVSDLINRFESS